MPKTPNPPPIVKRSRKKRDSEAARKAIYHAASESFILDGYFFTDTNRIARKAGYAPATFYQHYDEKFDVFYELYLDWCNQQKIVLGELLSKQLSIGVDVCEDASVKVSLHESSTETLRQFAKSVASALLPFYSDWKKFRSAFHVLVSEHTRLQDARNEMRQGFIQLVQVARGMFKKAPLPKEKCLTIILFVEAIGDAVANDEMDFFKVSIEQSEKFIEEIVMDAFQ